MKPELYKITYSQRHTFYIQINQQGYRVTSHNNMNCDKGKKRIMIFGDSFTQGSGLNDHQTYPFIIQDSLKNYFVQNYGISGYGVANVHKLLTEKYLPDSGDICIYSYFFQHNNRYERRVLKMMYAHPEVMGSLGYLLLREKDGAIVHEFVLYDYNMCFLSSYSALANLIEDKWNNYLDTKENIESEKLAYKAVNDMNEICKNNGANFVLAGIQSQDGTEKMLEHCKALGIRFLDISVNLNDTTFNQMPYDNHPNAKSNQIFAERIIKYLRTNSLIE
jgi:lysophospholipase L1-like esterase